MCNSILWGYTFFLLHTLQGFCAVFFPFSQALNFCHAQTRDYIPCFDILQGYFRSILVEIL